jgi:hypothetical protein
VVLYGAVVTLCSAVVTLCGAVRRMVLGGVREIEFKDLREWECNKRVGNRR